MSPSLSLAAGDIFKSSVPSLTPPMTLIFAKLTSVTIHLPPPIFIAPSILQFGLSVTAFSIM